MHFAARLANKSDKSPQVQKGRGGGEMGWGAGRVGYYLLLLMHRGIRLFMAALCVLT